MDPKESLGKFPFPNASIFWDLWDLVPKESPKKIPIPKSLLFFVSLGLDPKKFFEVLGSDPQKYLEKFSLPNPSVFWDFWDLIPRNVWENSHSQVPPFLGIFGILNSQIPPFYWGFWGFEPQKISIPNSFSFWANFWDLISKDF